MENILMDEYVKIVRKIDEIYEKREKIDSELNKTLNKARTLFKALQLNYDDRPYFRMDADELFDDFIAWKE